MAVMTLLLAALLGLEEPLDVLAPPGYTGGTLLVRGFAAFPKGRLSASPLKLVVDGKPQPAALTARALWPDGSLMLMAINTVLDGLPQRVTLVEGGPAAAAATLDVRPVQVPGGRMLLVRTGASEFLVPHDGAVPFLVLGNQFTTDAADYPSVSVLFRDGRAFRHSWRQTTYFNTATIRMDPGRQFMEVYRSGYYRAGVQGIPTAAPVLGMVVGAGGATLLIACEDGLLMHEPATGRTRALRGYRLLCFAYDAVRSRHLLGVKTPGGYTLEIRDDERAVYTLPLKVPPEKAGLYKELAVVASGNQLHFLELRQQQLLASAEFAGRLVQLAAGRGMAVLLLDTGGAMRIERYRLADGALLEDTELGELAGPLAMSANGAVLACLKADVIHIVDTGTGDDVCVVPGPAAALGLSPGGEMLAVLPTGEPPGAPSPQPSPEWRGSVGGDYGISVYDARTGSLVLTQPLARRVPAAMLAVDSNARVLAAAETGNVLAADTGEWPYRTVYSIWAGAPAIEVRHAVHLSGNPDEHFLFGATLPLALPEAVAQTAAEPGRYEVRLASGGRVFVEDRLPPRPWRTLAAQGRRIEYYPYSAAIRRPLDLRRYSNRVYTGHLYDESPGWGARSGQGSGLYSALLVSGAEQPYRLAWLVPKAQSLAASGIWGRFMPFEKAASTYPTISRLYERLRDLLVYTGGCDSGPFDLGDFPASPFVDGFLFQGEHGWRNGEQCVLEALLADFLAHPDWGRLELLERAAEHMYTVDMARFCDGRGDYWRASAQAAGAIRSAGVQHWSGQAGDVRRIGNAAGLADWFLVSGDRMAYEAAELAAEFGMRAKGARFEVLALFDLLACANLADGNHEQAARLFAYADATVTEMPARYRGLLASLYIIPQFLRHHAITGSAEAVEKANTLSPAQGGAYPENLLNLSLYWSLSGSDHARRQALAYLAGLARLPLASRPEIPAGYDERVRLLEGYYPSLLEKGFPVLRALPYLMAAMQDNNVPETEALR